MTTRTATCQCGQLTAACDGEPVRVSICHCHDCQTRSGSAFAWQGRWPEAQVTFSGTAKEWSRRNESGNVFTCRFCPDCGTTIAYTVSGDPGMVAMTLGSFAGAALPPPEYSVYEVRKQAWLEITGDMDHYD